MTEMHEKHWMLCCPVCKGKLAPNEMGANCAECGSMYPIEDGVPILVRSPEKLQVEIEAARDVSPVWYQEEQSPEAVSPWRHHLRRRRTYVMQVLRREMERRGLGAESRILDLGCGDGNNLVWLNDFTSSLFGSDYNMVRVARAKKKIPDATIFLADVLEYPAPNDFFDVIFFNHVIEHIPDDVAALREVRRILNPKGLLVLGAPNEGCWWWQLAYRRAPETLETTDHVHFYTRQRLQERMEQAGFSVFETKSMGFGPPDWELDGKIRKYKFVDDLFEVLGQTFMPSQASSLYLIAD